MKKFLSIFMVLILAFVFVSCSSKEYVDIPVTEVVTDENGEAVTDESGQVVTVEVTDKNGNTVTSRVEKSKTTTASTTSSNSNSSSSSASGDADESKKSGTTTTKKQSVNKNTTTTKKQTTTESTKSQKRDIKVTLKLPYYNGQETEITVSYKAEGDKKYSDLKTVKTKLDKTNKIQEFTIEDVKGAVSISVSLSGVDTTQNTATVAADKNAVTISPVTGIEIMEDID